MTREERERELAREIRARYRVALAATPRGLGDDGLVHYRARDFLRTAICYAEIVDPFPARRGPVCPTCRDWMRTTSQQGLPLRLLID